MGTDLHRSDTRSFGESHASELSSIASEITSPGIPSTPPSSTKPLSHAPAAVPKPAEHVLPNVDQGHVPPINPAALNQSLAPIPGASLGDGAPQPSPPPVVASLIPANSPTVAETGLPVAAGPAGPGPASGSLRDIKHNVAPGSEAVQKHESAEEEKKRLQAAYSQAAAPAQQPHLGSSVSAGTPTSHHESAEDEKKRLEREERERLLRSNTGNRDGASRKDGEEDLPPYQPL